MLLVVGEEFSAPRSDSTEIMDDSGHLYVIIDDCESVNAVILGHTPTHMSKLFI